MNDEIFCRFSCNVISPDYATCWWYVLIEYLIFFSSRIFVVFDLVCWVFMAIIANDKQVCFDQFLFRSKRKWTFYWSLKLLQDVYQVDVIMVEHVTNIHLHQPYLLTAYAGKFLLVVSLQANLFYLDRVLLVLDVNSVRENSPGFFNGLHEKSFYRILSMSNQWFLRGCLRLCSRKILRMCRTKFVIVRLNIAIFFFVFYF